jgi:hypothetical protein
VGILHTPRDNLTTINALTSADPTGQTVSEGWAKGMEMCAHMEGWYMLQPEMGGGQPIDRIPAAYFEALPNEAVQGQAVRFDAAGSYQYESLVTRQRVDDSRLTYTWTFGDGTTATGRSVRHPYGAIGRYQARLTVKSLDTGRSDSMTVPITVVGSNFAGPTLHDLPATDADGTFDLAWDFTGTRDGLRSFRVDEATDPAVALDDDAEGDINGKWTPSDTGSPTLQRWQPSNGSPAVNGNKRHSGQSSYWTGAFPPAPSPTDVESDLTLKQPIQVPDQGSPELSYWSLFQSEGDDEGRVEIALTDGTVPPDKLDWRAVDGTAGFFAPVGAVSVDPNVATAELQPRRADLSAYKGKKILVRFRYILGPEDRAASQPAGWYVDDIRILSGTWHGIGTTQAQKFTVTNRGGGRYGYRVVGVYGGGVETAPSNVAVTQVTW